MTIPRQNLRSPANGLLTILFTGLTFATPALATLAASIPQQVPAQQAEATIESRYKQATEDYEKAFDEFEKKATINQPFHFDLSSLAEYLQTQMHADADLPVRQRAALYLSTLSDYDVLLPESTYLEVARLIAPESALWNKAPDSIHFISERLSPETARKFLNDLVSRNPDRAIQARAIISLAKLASRQHDAVAFQTNYQLLAANYKDEKDLVFDIALLNPNNKTAIGKKVAAFTLPSVENSKPFSNQSLSGSYYLLDFWATWCGPCMGERAALLQAYERFKGKNFTIVSISLDEKPETVKHFLATRWAMPWENLLLPGGQHGQTAKDYDVSWLGLPHLLLVGPDGTILAIRDQLTGASLQKTLAEFLDH